MSESSMYNFLAIYKWMRGLNLTRVELDLYALIYSFSRDGQAHALSRGYMAEELCASTSAISKAGRSLVDKGLVVVSRSYDKKGQGWNVYKAIVPDILVESTPEDSPKKPEKPKRKRFVPPTEQEVQEYCTEKGYTINSSDFVDFYVSKGWKVGTSPMRDWKASVRTWVRREGGTTKDIGKPITEIEASDITMAEVQKVCDSIYNEFPILTQRNIELDEDKVRQKIALEKRRNPDSDYVQSALEKVRDEPAMFTKG